MKRIASSRRGAAALASVLVAGPLLAAGNSPERSPQSERALALVRQLGDPSFPVREKAGAELFRLGLSAREALTLGASDVDPEVRRSCRGLLPAVLESDRKFRVEAFLADKDCKKQHDLPGWDRFKGITGDNSAARKLFAEVMKGDGGRFLADYDAAWGRRQAAAPKPEGKGGPAGTSAPDPAADLFLGRCQMLQERMYGNMRMGGFRNPGTSPQITLGEVASVLFVASDSRLHLPPNAGWVVPQFLYQPAPREGLTQGPQPSPFRKLLLEWMKSQTDENGMQQVFYLAINLDIKEALDVAVKALREKSAKGHGLGMAMIVVGKLGNKEHLALLEPYLADNTPLGTFRFNDLNISTEMRDVALAVSVKLTGQQHRDYDFPFMKMGQNMIDQSPYYLGFTAPAQRDAAFKKWRSWQAAQKKK